MKKTLIGAAFLISMLLSSCGSIAISENSSFNSVSSLSFSSYPVSSEVPLSNEIIPSSMISFFSSEATLSSETPVSSIPVYSSNLAENSSSKSSSTSSVNHQIIYNKDQRFTKEKLDYYFDNYFIDDGYLQPINKGSILVFLFDDPSLKEMEVNIESFPTLQIKQITELTKKDVNSRRYFVLDLQTPTIDSLKESLYALLDYDFVYYSCPMKNQFQNYIYDSPGLELLDYEEKDSSFTKEGIDDFFLNYYNDIVKDFRKDSPILLKVYFKKTIDLSYEPLQEFISLPVLTDGIKPDDHIFRRICLIGPEEELDTKSSLKRLANSLLDNDYVFKIGIWGVVSDFVWA